jgi:hypothetical protein
MNPQASPTVRLVGTDAWNKQWDNYRELHRVADAVGADFWGQDADDSTAIAR